MDLNGSASSLSSKDVFSGEHGGAVASGVGILFQQESNGNVVVKTIVNGGSAERDGNVCVGDLITKVDGRDVIGEQLPFLRNLILGPQGTPVTLGFRRGMSEYEVRLIRGTAEYFSALRAQQQHSYAPSRLPVGDLDDDVDALRLKLRQALALGASDRDELERLRKMLQMERDLAARRDAEIKQGQAHHHDEVLRIQEAIRKAEQARRDAEIKLLPLQQREGELSEELMRQREKERLRKEYIEELKRRFEEEKSSLEQTLAAEQAQRRDDLVARHQADSMLQKINAELHRMKEIEEIRRDREQQYRERYEGEQARLMEASQHEERLRNTLRDTDTRLGRWNQEYFGNMPYSPEELDVEPTEAFMLA